MCALKDDDDDEAVEVEYKEEDDGGVEAIARRYGGRIDGRSHAPPRSHSSPSDRVLRPATRVLSYRGKGPFFV